VSILTRIAINPDPATRSSRERLSGSRYALQLEKIGYEMYYGGNGAYLYQPIPKNACTTIKTLLLRAEGLPVDENVWRRHQKEYNRFPGTHHLPIDKQLDIFKGRTDTFKFVIARNPYARLASAYCDKILRNPAVYIIRNLKKSAAEYGIHLPDRMTFAQFVNVICRERLEQMNAHYRPQYYEGRFEIVKYDFIGRMETLPVDLTYIFERIGAPETVLARAHERNNVAGSDLELWETVPAETVQLFLSVFEIDFDLLQYPRRLPRRLSVEYP